MTAKTIMDVLEQQVRAQPDKTAFTYIGREGGELRTLSFVELSNLSKNLARQITTVPLSRGSGKRGPALLLFNQSLDFIVSFFACLYAGIVAIPVSVPTHVKGYRRLAAIMQDARVDLVLTHSPVVANLSREVMHEFFQQVEILAVDQIGWDSLSHSAVADPWQQPVQDLAFLQYTSGSTGLPKGVMVTHQNILANEKMIQEVFGVDADDIAASWLPTFHDMGLIGSVLGSIYVGTSTYLMSPQDFIRKPLAWLKAISDYRVSITGGPNFGYEWCIDRIRETQMEGIDLSSWRVAFNGAEPVKAGTLQKFTDRFAAFGFDPRAHTPCYGLAETTLLVSSKRRNQAVNHYCPDTLQAVVAPKSWVGSGQPASGQTVVIANENAEPAAPGEVGEIWIHGPHVAAGYWNRETDTGNAFGNRLGNAPQYAGMKFLRTGDLGVICGDELIVTGRSKDLIILRGRNIYPQDVEELVEEVAGPRLRRGSTVVVANANGSGLVVLAEMANKDTAQEEQHSLVRDVRQAVTECFNAVPEHILLLEKNSIPKTTSGKLQRALARRNFLDQQSTAQL